MRLGLQIVHCEACGWRGRTRHQVAHYIFVWTFILGCLVLVMLDALAVIELGRGLSLPAVVALLIVIYIIPSVLRRTERCPRCRSRQLVPGENAS
jgi:hypothetical protein